MLCPITAYSGTAGSHAVFDGEQEKESDGIEKFVPRDHCLSSLRKPRAANQ